MRRLKLMGLAIVAVFALAAIAVASASAALPEVKTALGEAFPAVASGESGNATLSTALSSPITATGVKIKIEFSKASDEGTYTANFTGTTFEKEQCNTEGDADNTVLVSGKLNLVVALNAAKTGNQFAGAFTVPAGFNVKCGPLGKVKLTIPVEGIAIGAIEEVTESKELTTFKGNLKCTKPSNGKQELKEFKNEAGTFEKQILKANLGLGNESGCEEVEKAVPLTSTKMIEFINIK
jgi:opacity protein-like surface antigen